MRTFKFKEFKEANSFARTLASYFDVTAEMRRKNEYFTVTLPEPLKILNIDKFTKYALMFNGPSEVLRSIFPFVDLNEFSSKSLVWHDDTTLLTWDLKRLFSTTEIGVIPLPAWIIMNAFEYGGLKGWRLPTISELKTLNLSKLNNAGLELCEGGHKFSFWSSEDSSYSGPEKSFFNIESREGGDQRFIEQERNSSTLGDGYTEIAGTVLVTSEN